jgi:hypothetical protein
MANGTKTLTSNILNIFCQYICNTNVKRLSIMSAYSIMKSVLSVNRLLSTLISCTMYEQYSSQIMEHNMNSTLEFITLFFASIHGTAQSQDSLCKQKCTGGTN